MVSFAREVRTAYTADRAAALAGVPLSTLHYWTRTGLLTPSVSPERVKLWSLEDLVAIRIIDWLRRPKEKPPGLPVRPTSMRAIRRLMRQLGPVAQNLWDSSEGSPIRVDPSGRLYIQGEDNLRDLQGQLAMGTVLDPLAPFEGEKGIMGPDLLRPKPHIRIVPGKLAGEPHIEGTRIETRILAALARRGWDVGGIVELYPHLRPDQVGDALDLERQLAGNVEAA